MNQEFKYRFLTLKTNYEKPKTLLRDMINEYIKKLRKDIELDSSPDAKYGADRIKLNAELICELLDWRDNVDLIGSNEVYDMSSLDFNDRFKRIYSDK